MKKQLVEARNIEAFISEGNKIYVDNSMILTPGAKDALSARRVEIIYGEAKSVALDFGALLQKALRVSKTSMQAGGAMATFESEFSRLLRESGAIAPVDVERYTKAAISKLRTAL